MGSSLALTSAGMEGEKLLSGLAGDTDQQTVYWDTILLFRQLREVPELSMGSMAGCPREKPHILSRDEILLGPWPALVWAAVTVL